MAESEVTAMQPQSIIINFDFKIENKRIGEIRDCVTLAMSPDSTGVFALGADIEKFSGLPEADILRDVKAGKESKDDAIIYGLCNIMNGGKDIYFWTNGTRLGGAAEKSGIWPAIMEQVSHECTHLARTLICRAIAKNEGISIENEDWVKHDWGSGEYMWPAMGDPDDKKNPIVLIDEESFATTVGLVVQKITPHFLKMAAAYIPQMAGIHRL